MIVASAQTIPVKGDVNKNIKNHIVLINQAQQKDVDLIVFPELSLTGYEPELAKSLAFSESDDRLKPLLEKAEENKMIIIVGAPYCVNDSLHIASFILYPNKQIAIYTKRYLHPGEEKFFEPKQLDPQIKLNGQVASLAICADINNPVHPENAYKKGADIYLAGVCWTTNGYEKDIVLLKEYAKKYNMLIVMSNFGGDSGGYEAAGGSVILSKEGMLISLVEGKREGLAIAKLEDGNWLGVL